MISEGSCDTEDVENSALHQLHQLSAKHSSILSLLFVFTSK